MKVCEHRLTGSNQNQISTELKFLIATAHFDGTELLRLVYDVNSTDRIESRLRNVVIKVLRSLRARRSIQFFVMPEDFGMESTEVEYLLNKYQDHFSSVGELKENERYCYLKI